MTHEQHLVERDALVKAAEHSSDAGNYADAIGDLEQAIEITQEVRGMDDEEVIQLLATKAGIETANGRYFDAITTSRTALDLGRRIYDMEDWRLLQIQWGIEHIEQLNVLTTAEQDEYQYARQKAQQAQTLVSQGRLEEALAIAIDVKNIQMRLFGESDYQSVASVAGVAAIYTRLNQFDKATPLLKSTLTIREQHVGKTHPDYIQNVVDLASCLEITAALAEQKYDVEVAHTCYQDVLLLKSKLYPPDHWQVRGATVKVQQLDKIRALSMSEVQRLQESDSQFTRAMILLDNGNVEEALELAQDVADTCRTILGGNSPKYAEALNLLGNTALDFADVHLAHSSYRNALRINEMVFGADHPTTATSLYNLAEYFRTIGDFARAEPLYQLAAADVENALTVGYGYYEMALKHTYAETLNGWAILLKTTGDYVRAEQLYIEAKGLWETLPDKSSVARAWHNLGTLYFASGKLADAEASLKECTRILEDTGNEESQLMAAALMSLGAVYHAKGDVELARVQFQRAADFWQRVHREHPNHAIAMMQLGLLQRDEGDLRAAEQSLRQAVELLRKSLRPGHFKCAVAEFNLGLLYFDMMKYADAKVSIIGALDDYEALLQDTFGVQCERQRFAYLSAQRGALDALISLYVAGTVEADVLYRHVLEWKGAVSARAIEELVVHDQKHLKNTIDQLAEVRSRLALKAFAIPDPRHRAVWLADLETLQERKELLEGELAKEGAGLDNSRAGTVLDAAAVASVTPDGSVLLDFIEYKHLLPRVSGMPAEGEQRMLVFVVSREGSVRAISLGPTKTIDEPIRMWRESLRIARDDALLEIAKQIRTTVWSPIEDYVVNARTVLVSPDGALSEFPFAALPGQGPHKYLLTEKAISYVPSARQLLEASKIRSGEHARGAGFMAIGGIEYDKSHDGSALASPTGRHALVDEEDKARFKYLPGTLEEAKQAKASFETTFQNARALLLTAAEPDESRIKSELSSSWRFVHIAGHGFFHTHANAATTESMSNATQGGVASVKAAQQTYLLNPKLLSGIPFAGANIRKDAIAFKDITNDGILTAEEVSSLDMRGTDLVVLSGCDTGRGLLFTGEGVIGLQLALQAAGTRTVIASQWRVDDTVTQQLMSTFYAQLFQKETTKLEALRHAQREVLERGPGNSGHPRYWAAWVLSGDPG